jgi:hypothetical protein
MQCTYAIEHDRWLAQQSVNSVGAVTVAIVMVDTVRSLGGAGCEEGLTHSNFCLLVP